MFLVKHKFGDGDVGGDFGSLGHPWGRIEHHDCDVNQGLVLRSEWLNLLCFKSTRQAVQWARNAGSASTGRSRKIRLEIWRMRQEEGRDLQTKRTWNVFCHSRVWIGLLTTIENQHDSQWSAELKHVRRARLEWTRRMDLTSRTSDKKVKQAIEGDRSEDCKLIVDVIGGGWRRCRLAAGASGAPHKV